MLSATEQTKKTWAQKLESYEEIPAVYRPHVEKLLSADEPFPLAILTPTVTYTGFRRRLIEKLIFQVGNSLYVVENGPSGIIFIEHCKEHINCIETASMLLRAWIKIESFAGDQLVTSLLEFNAVSMGLFRPMIMAMRQTLPSSGTEPNPERDKFNYLIGQDFKFMNYARKSIAPGATVCAFILQPEITEPLLKRWALEFYRTLVPKHMCILTDKELILIQEEWKPRRYLGSPKYGAIWRYIPVSRISSMQINPQSDELLSLSIFLSGGQDMDILFAVSHQTEVQRLADAFLAVRSGNGLA